jgi:PPM family protein phosphatase
MAAGGQILGGREIQEDAYSISYPTLRGSSAPALLAIVADGIGGYGGGRIASHMAAKVFAESLTESLSRAEEGSAVDFSAAAPSQDVLREAGQFAQYLSVGDAQAHTAQTVASEGVAKPGMPMLLTQALTRANLALADAKARSQRFESMGSTFVAAVIKSGKLWWVSVGDSQLYLVRQNKLEKKNVLHTYGELLDSRAKAGQAVKKADAKERKRLTSSLDGQDIPLLDCSPAPLQLQAEDVVVLASDGLNALTETKIVFAAATADSAEECTAQLLKAVEALAYPKQDNTTVVVIQHGKRVLV